MKFDRDFWSPLLLLVITLSLVFFYITILSKTPLFLTAQYRTGDILFRYQPAFLSKLRLSPKPSAIKKIVVIGVDDESKQRLDRAWPWSREIFAAFLVRIRTLNPKVIGFDFSFSGKGQSPEADLWFADEIAKSGNVILASFFDRKSVTPYYAYILPNALLLKAAKTVGFINVPYDQDGTVRRSRVLLKLADNLGFAYSMPLQLACAYLNRRPENTVEIRGKELIFRLPSLKNTAKFKKIRVPIDRRYHIPISYSYRPDKFRYIPFWKIIAGKVDRSEIEGKIVLVGITSDIAHDTHETPFGLTPGVFIIAQQTVTILEQDFVRKLWPAEHWIFLLILTFIFTLVFHRLHYLNGLIVLLIAESSVYFFTVWIFTAHKLIFSIFSTMLVLILVYLVVLFYRGLMTLLENTALQHQVSTDGLTGLHNHAYMARRLRVEFDHCRQIDKEFCFVMIDIDFFKRVNDTYGHEQGNQVLARLADALKNGVRKNDVVARYGGEEFSIILFDCNVAAASLILGKISHAVEETVFTTEKENFHVTISAGVCSNRENGLNRVGDIIRFADEALYQAKAEGRNRVCIHQAPLSSFIYSSR